MFEYIECSSCRELYPESEIKEINNDNAICIHCASKLQYQATQTSYTYDESKRPKFQYEDKYGNMNNIHNQLVAGQELNMGGLTFEFFCADLLLIEGFKNIQLTKATGDNGVDIMADKNGKKYIFQCKCLSHTCSNKAVQEIVSANTMYKADGMGVICNTTFSQQAKSLAYTNNVELYSIGTIKHILDKYACDFYEEQKSC